MAGGGATVVPAVPVGRGRTAAAAEWRGWSAPQAGGRAAWRPLRAHTQVGAAAVCSRGTGRDKEEGKQGNSSSRALRRVRHGVGWGPEREAGQRWRRRRGTARSLVEWNTWRSNYSPKNVLSLRNALCTSFAPVCSSTTPASRSRCAPTTQTPPHLATTPRQQAAGAPHEHRQATAS